MRHCLVTIVTNHLALVVSGTFVVSGSKTGLDWTGLEKCGLVKKCTLVNLNWFRFLKCLCPVCDVACGTQDLRIHL